MLFSPQDFPNLHSGNYRDVRAATKRYNCIAWAAGIDDDWWDPASTRTWPGSAPRDWKLTSLIVVYEWAGFVICADAALEDGVEKIAIYVDGPEWMHAARQLANGKWTSKIGELEEIEHDTLEDLEGPAFGKVTTYMQRPRRA